MKITKLAFVLLALLSTSLVNAEPSLRVVTIAGVPGEAGFRDGDSASALFDRPTWIEQDESGRLYVVDRRNAAIRAIAPFGVYTLHVFKNYAQEQVPLDFGLPFGGGIASEPRVAGCGGAQYGEAIFVASTADHQVMMVVDVSREGWTVGDAYLAERDDIPTKVGVRGEAGSRDGYGNSFYDHEKALLTGPGDIALSANYKGRASANDAIYIADTGNHTIRRARLGESLENCNGLLRVDTLAGGARLAGYADGVGLDARFNTPRGIATAPDGSIYVSDSGNHVIRRIAPGGVVSTVAGQPGVPGHHDGPALEALLNTPSGLAVNDAGELFIADTSNHCIRKLTLDGRLVTIAGTPGIAGYADGDSSSARFAGPVGIALSPSGIVVADTSNNVIRRIEVQSSRVRPVRPEK